VRILALTRYDQMGASSRLRTLQYLPGLRSSGARVDVSPLFDDRYVLDMYAGRISPVHVARRYAKRLRDLFQMNRYDVVWTEKELLPWLPSSFELGMLSRSTRLVVDYDDALFHRYDQHRSQVVRGLLGAKIDAVMRRADLVLAGNYYLAERARKAGSRWVEWLPTVVDLDRYETPTGTSGETHRSVTIGWMGSPATASYLGAVAAPLAELSASGRVKCVAIGALQDQVFGTPFTSCPWEEHGEAEALRGFDIGIMPLPDAPWEQGKCGYKLIQYMASGLPVVASPVGANVSIVQPGRNGLLATTEHEWFESLSRLVADGPLRKAMGRQGRAMVEKSYSLQVQAPRLEALLTRLVDRKAGAA
jgi:hypothetical protein